MRQEISNIVLNRLKDPRVSFVTITGVELTDDLKIAKVFISVLKKSDTKETLKILNRASSFIRQQLGKTIKLKYIPTLDFCEDSSIEYADKIDKLLKEIKGDINEPSEENN
ncbi:ribosome-binding factor A [Candidatus Magnetoovum chiemensis]|nr:ribosome-binding factor A [Candidatus Magnetoovum chiemensis]